MSRKSTLLLIVLSALATAQTMQVHTSEGIQNYSLESIDSITFEFLPSSGLMNYYPFNGSAKDVSGNSGSGTIEGAALASDRFGNPEKAFSFDGSDDYIVFDGISSSNQMTVCAWAYPVGNAAGSSSHLLTYFFGDRSNRGYDSVQVTLIQRHDNVWGGRAHYITQAVADNFTGYVTGPTVSANGWVFLAYTYDYKNNRAELYVDGASVGTSDASKPTHRAGMLYIGSHPNPTGFFEGRIDDIRIYERILSIEEIQALFHEGGWEG